MLPVPTRERSAVPAAPAAPSPPALVRVDASLVGLAGSLAVLPLAFAATAGFGGVLDVLWAGSWMSAVRSMAPQVPTGAGVLLPQLTYAVFRALESLLSLGVPLAGLTLGLVAVDSLRTRLRPWDPAAHRWFDGTHQLLVASGVVGIYLTGATAAITALVVPAAFWLARPAHRTGESLRAAATVTGLAAGGMVLGQAAVALFQVLGPLPKVAWNLLELEGLARVDLLRYVYLPLVRSSLGESLAGFLGVGIFLAPVTAALARGMRRCLPQAPRLAVATLGVLPGLVLAWSGLRGLGIFGFGYNWATDALRDITLAAPIATLQLWMALGWAGAVVLPHVAAAALGAGRAEPASPEAPQLPAPEAPQAALPAELPCPEGA